MYVSRLMLDPQWFARQNRYQLHQALWRAFPDRAAGGPGRVLFRVEPVPVEHASGQVNWRVLVQSDRKPQWQDLRHRDRMLAGEPEYRPYDPPFRTRYPYQFRLCANPTVKRNNRRYAITAEEDRRAWLTRKASTGGFALDTVTVVQEQTVLAPKPQTVSASRHDLTLVAVRYDGVLHVTDTQQFKNTLAQGIGSGKAFGFGLLSAAPCTP